MEAVLRLVIRTLIIIIGILIFIRFLLLLLNRAPGVIVSLSIITSSVLLIALYKGSFKAVGLRTKRSVAIALTISFIILLVSSAILLFLK